MPRYVAKWLRSASQRTHVLGLQTLGAAGHVELNALTLGQGAEALGLDGGVVAEQILAPALLRDETEALRVVEPLHGTSRHYSSSFSSGRRSMRRNSVSLREPSALCGIFHAIRE